MKTLALSLAVVVGLALAAPARAAECYADYKAKQDNPLKLHYGVIELPDAACGSKADAQAAISPRVAKQGWTLLNILSIFGPEGLEERKESAGRFYLAF